MIVHAYARRLWDTKFRVVRFNSTGVTFDAELFQWLSKQTEFVACRKPILICIKGGKS